MTREEIEQLNEVEPNCFETSREEQWYRVGLKEGLETADNSPKWISVDDDLPYKHDELYEVPTQTKYVLVVLEYILHGYTYRKVSTRYMQLERVYTNGEKDWRWYQVKSYRVTHWMPLPNQPK